jgi:hypothetical protein
MNIIGPTFDQLVRRPTAAVVQAAFDEEHALAEVRRHVKRRDAAKGEYKNAVIDIGRLLVEVRRAMPGVKRVNGQETPSAQFLAFVEKCGFTKAAAWQYMSYARNPEGYLDRIKANAKLGREQRAGWKFHRRQTLAEIVDMLRAADSIEQAIETIQGELNEAT